MADASSDDSGTEWYEEPVTIIGFVAGFLLLILVVASILILCHSKDEEEEEDEDNEEEHDRTGHMRPTGNHVMNGVQSPGNPMHAVEHEESSWRSNVTMDKTNPLYVNANEFALKPYPQTLRANFVHIHVDDKLPKDKGFMAYYNT